MTLLGFNFVSLCIRILVGNNTQYNEENGLNGAPIVSPKFPILNELLSPVAAASNAR
jgi:hypothetical protein